MWTSPKRAAWSVTSPTCQSRRRRASVRRDEAAARAGHGATATGNGTEGPAAQRAHIPGGRSHATITIRHENGSLSSYGFTADYLRELDSWQFDHAEGPCYDGVTHNAFTDCGDLRSDPRYPSYEERAVAAGIRPTSA